MLMNSFEVEISALLVSYPSVPDYYILHLKCLDYRGVSIKWGVPISEVSRSQMKSPENEFKM